MQDRPPFVMHVVYNECCYVLRAGEGGKYMAQINVNNLTFAYEGSFDNVFENTSFSIDTNWRLGFVGRNGKGKTTFLNLLLGKYEYEGNISTNTIFDYFPYIVNSEELTKTAGELIESWKPGVEIWRVMCELPELSIDAELLYRPFGTLSFGERTKIMYIITYTRIITDIPDFHKELEQYEIYNGLKSKAEFEEIVLSRFTSWSEDNQLFECSIFQNIIENQILYLQMNDDEIVDFYRRVKDTLKGKKYKIIYLSVDNVREAEEIIKKERSDEAGNEMWFPVMIKYLEGAPFFKAHGYIGMEGLVKHLEHRVDLERRILREVFEGYYEIIERKIGLENTNI